MTDSTSSNPLRDQVLMIDADDTLWENNIYFERAIEEFTSIVNHSELSRQQVRAAFDLLEADRVVVHGYGSGAFHKSMLAGFTHLTGLPCDDAVAAQLLACADGVRHAGIDLLDGVEETLPRLAMQHTIILVTKGDPEEQQGKLERSGLAPFFQHVEVLREKHTDAYLHLLQKYDSSPAITWMIGNSPRSDTNPALMAGMHAVHLPHPSTWSLEQEPIAAPGDGQRLLHLTSFRELLHHFG